MSETRSYRQSLAFCAKVAREEHRVASAALVRTEESLENLARKAKRIKSRMHNSPDAVGDAKERIERVSNKLEHELGQSIQRASASLERKRERLGKFTVTLFGRTLAGKSTIREALTGGDGSTIGKGAQRTTRDVREYEWDHLRIVDTPGIGAYEGEEDRKLALSVIDESDLVLFLVSSDGLQKTVFEGLRSLRDQNKPIVFVLNVKKDLTQPVYLRRFLKKPHATLGRDATSGSVRRIHKLAGEVLGMRNVKVVTIHAQAAFLATQPQHASRARDLRQASRIGDLHGALRREVRDRGPVRRTQTILDGTTTALTDLQEECRELARTLSEGAGYLEEKFGELDSWLDLYIPAANKRFEDGSRKRLAPLRRGVSSFVDDNIESKNFGKRWKKQVKAVGMESWAADQQHRTMDEIRARLEQFQREMDLESDILGKLDSGNPTSCDPFEAKRTLRWVSAGGAALASVAGVALMLGGANFWNPVGWIASGVGLVALGLSWFFDSREEKLQRQKRKTSDELRDQVDALERQLANELKGWFYRDVTRRLVHGIRKDTRALVKAMRNVSSELRKAARRCDAQVAAQNRRLVNRVASFHGIDFPERHIQRIVRDPSMCAKLRWSGSRPEAPVARVVGRAIGEWIHEVEPGPVATMTAQALAPARIDPAMVHEHDQGVRVFVPQQEMGRAIGRRGANVRLASRLMKTQIEIQRGGS